MKETQTGTTQAAIHRPGGNSATGKAVQTVQTAIQAISQEIIIHQEKATHRKSTAVRVQSPTEEVQDTGSAEAVPAAGILTTAGDMETGTVSEKDPKEEDSAPEGRRRGNLTVTASQEDFQETEKAEDSMEKATEGGTSLPAGHQEKGISPE